MALQPVRAMVSMRLAAACVLATGDAVALAQTGGIAEMASVRHATVPTSQRCHVLPNLVAANSVIGHAVLKRCIELPTSLVLRVLERMLPMKPRNRERKSHRSRFRGNGGNGEKRFHPVQAHDQTWPARELARTDQKSARKLRV